MESKKQYFSPRSGHRFSRLPTFRGKVVAGGGAQQRIQTKVSNQQCHSVAKHYEIVGGIYQGLTVY